MRCRLLPHATLSGPEQMARDEALLASAAEDPDAAIVRTYGWSRPTLSLGYFQEIAEAEADPRWADVPIVRRATGGGAIWHHHDVTYSAVIPEFHPFARKPAELYTVVHGAILTVLAGLGFPVEKRGGSPDPSRTRPFLCFLDRDPADLLDRGSKVVGSAQRRRHGAVLQHGSILLQTSDRTPELPGLGLASGFGGAIEPLRRAIVGSLGLDPADEDLTMAEEELAARLAREVYSQPGWTRRR